MTQLESPYERLEQSLLKVVDGALAGAVFVVPFILGGNHAWGRLALVLMAAIAAVAWTVRQSLNREARWRLSGAEPILLAGMLLVVLQVTPLPSGMVNLFSPRSKELIPLWSSAAQGQWGFGSWEYISMYPNATRHALSIYLAYMLLFFVAVQRLRKLEDIERMLRWIAASAGAMAVFGLVQYLLSNGKFYWCYEHLFSDTSQSAKGAFVCRNHFAQFLALGLGPMLWWTWQTLRKSRQPSDDGFAAEDVDAGRQQVILNLKLLLLGVMLFAGLLSLSRGGALALTISAVLCIGLLVWKRLLTPRYAATLGSLALLTGVFLLVFGYDEVSGRLDDFTVGGLEELDHKGVRRTIWAANMRAVPDFARLGAGIGTHRYIYPLYMDGATELEYTHAENGPLQVTLEAGIPGLLLLLCGIAVIAFWCVMGLKNSPGPRTSGAFAAVSAGMAASLTQSLMDFAWYIPGCTVILVLLAACAARLWQQTRTRNEQPLPTFVLPQHAWISVAALVLLAGLWMTSDRFGGAWAASHWEQYLWLTRAQEELAAQQAEETASSVESATPQEPSANEPVPVVKINTEQMLASGEQLRKELEAVLSWEPTHARAHQRLAALNLQMFDLAQMNAENGMTVGDIADAASASQFSSKSDLEEWLNRAVKENQKYLSGALTHARSSVNLCPVEGSGYLYLSELSFLEGATAEIKKGYLAQALRVRPHDGSVLRAAGKQALTEGNYDLALEYWRKAFSASRYHQRQLINSLAGRVPVDFLLEAFQPDLAAIRLIYTRYRDLDNMQALHVVSKRYAQLAEGAAQVTASRESADLWLEAHNRYYEQGDVENAFRCAQQAVSRDANNFDAHYTLGGRLLEQGQYALAEEELRWCSQRRPHDEKLQSRLRLAVKGRISGNIQAATYEGAPPLQDTRYQTPPPLQQQQQPMTSPQQYPTTATTPQYNTPQAPPLRLR